MTEPMAGDGSADMGAQLTIRPASASDRNAVLALAADAEGVGAPIQADTWDAALTQGDGVVLIASADAQPIGVMRLRIMSPDTGWLEGIYVVPAFRRRGVGGMLMSRGLAAAHEREVSVVRLFVAPSNTTGQRLLKRFGFVHIAELVRYVAPALVDVDEATAEELAEGEPEDLLADEDEAPDVQAPRLMLPGEEDFGRIWEWLERSTLAPFNGGFELLGWGARKLVEPEMRAYLRGGHVWLFEEWDAIQGLAAALPVEARGAEPATLEVRYMDGTAEGISRLALVLREVAAERDLASVVLWLPNLLILRDAMAGAGYNDASGGPLWIFTRVL